MVKSDIEYIYSDNLVDYLEAIAIMEKRVEHIRHHKSSEAIWFLQHPSLYSAGTSAQQKDLLTPDRFPIYETGRGGQYTYHGPGQLIAYVMIDIQTRKIGIREYIKILETIIIQTLSSFNIKGEIRDGRVGVWVENNHTEEKIAAIGVRVRRGVTYHGLAINLNPDLSAFSGIIPCGLNEFGVTSFEKLNVHFQQKDIMDKIYQNLIAALNI